MTKTRIEKLWDKLDELKAALHGNPHININEAQKAADELEQLAMKIRFSELKRKLRKK